MSTRKFWATLRKYGAKRFSVTQPTLSPGGSKTRVRMILDKSNTACPVTFSANILSGAHNYMLCDGYSAGRILGLTCEESKAIMNAADYRLVKRKDYLVGIIDTRRHNRLRRKLFSVLNLNKKYL